MVLFYCPVDWLPTQECLSTMGRLSVSDSLEPRWLITHRHRCTFGIIRKLMISTIRLNLNNVITQSGLIISGGSIWRLRCSDCWGKHLLDHHHHFHHCSIINKPSSSLSSLLESANCTQIRRWTAKAVFSHLAWLICTPTSTNMQHPLASTRRYAWRGFLHTFLYWHTTALGKGVQPKIKSLKCRKMSQDFTDAFVTSHDSWIFNRSHVPQSWWYVVTVDKSHHDISQWSNNSSRRRQCWCSHISRTQAISIFLYLSYSCFIYVFIHFLRHYVAERSDCQVVFFMTIVM